MKRKNIVNVLFSFILLCFFSSCLKDKEYDEGRTGIKPDKNSKLVEIEGPASGIIVTSLDASPADTTFNIISLRLAADQPAQSDIQVTLKLDPAAVAAYNTKNNTSYEVPAANLYSIPSLTVTILKGSRVGHLKLKTIPNNLTGIAYALGFTIEASSDPSVQVSGNYKTLVAAIGVKNQYEGDYKSVGYFQHPTAPRAFNLDKYFFTVSSSSSEMQLGDLGAYVVVTVNSDNSVTIGPGTGTSGTTASVAKIDGDAAYNNTYDPVTRTFKLKYGYPMPGPTRIVTETVTRQ